MLELYEKVERATQFVFSGSSYRGLLLWAADKEERPRARPQSPSLKHCAVGVGVPARQLLKPETSLAPPPTEKAPPATRYAQLAKMADRVHDVKPPKRRSTEEKLLREADAQRLRLAYDRAAGLAGASKLRPLRGVPAQQLRSIRRGSGG